MVSGDFSGVQVFFVVQPIDGGNLLIEVYENDHVYLLGPKLGKRTYGDKGTYGDTSAPADPNVGFVLKCRLEGLLILETKLISCPPP